ncbi:MAG: S41 family peptidase [Prevotellaceae bacterium]|jgi:carboxyl-terminal processing protease|nr:S41 family peptidase [Prevotellaceae bacterium]
MKKNLSLLLFAILGISLFAQKSDSKFEISKNLDIYNSVFKELYLNYVDTLNVEKVVRSGIDEMLGELDPYTNYIPESEKGDFRLMITGEYGGVGAIISQRDKQIVVAELYEGMPADKAGVKAGDIIVEIDGTKIVDKTVSDVSTLLKGVPKTVVKVVFNRDGKQVTKEIRREQIKMNPVVYYGVIGENTGYVYLASFTTGNTANELRKALLDLKKNHHIGSFVLDLRDNPGGDLEEAIAVSNLFLPRGVEIVSTKGKNRQANETFKTKDEPVDTQIPMAVLVSRGSASAAEIVAGALQDLDRAVVIGSRTFGKGLVQSTKPVSYNGLLKVTTAKYYIPSGRCIQAIDYTHRNKDGSVAAIPDSLTKEFKTKGGRIVRDGGGIKPDIEIKTPEEINITYRLLADSWIFNFATIYCQKHQEIPPVEQFVFTDEDFEDFKKYLKENNFSYSLRSADLLEKLKETAKVEGYSERASEALEALKAALQPDTDKDLDLFKDDIVKLLSAEIAKRFYYQKGEIIERLKRDEASKKAIEILQNQEEYQRILSPQ